MDESLKEQQPPKTSRRKILAAMGVGVLASTLSLGAKTAEALSNPEDKERRITTPAIVGFVFKLPLNQVMRGEYHKPEPIAGFTVALSEMRKTDTGSESVGEPIAIQTDKEGMYIFEGVKPGLYSVGHGHINTARDRSFLQIGPQFRDQIEITDQTGITPGAIWFKIEDGTSNPQNQNINPQDMT